MDVSRESQGKLDAYLQLLRKWQRAVNLVSNNTLGDAQHRHFDDSLQLAGHIPQGAVVFDLGSGGGFPGLPLAMIRPDLDVSLIESDTKKCTFLSTVSRETKTPVVVVNKRIEEVELDIIPAIIIARALAPLDKLLGYCLGWASLSSELVILLLKGGKAAEEIEAARRKYAFEVESFSSKTASESCILKITKLYVNPST